MNNRKNILSVVFLFSIIAVGSISIIFSNNVFAEDKPLPNWIKNTALWWAEGKVGDSDFINALQFLINSDILTIPQSSVAESKEKLFMKQSEFSMWQPENWERQWEIPDPQTGLPTSMIVESSMLERIDATNISVVIEDMSGLSLDDYTSIAKNYLENLAGGKGNINYLDQGYTKIDDRDAYFHEIEVNLGIILKNKQIIVENDGKAYIITYNANVKNYDKHIDQFEEMMSTFKFL